MSLVVDGSKIINLHSLNQCENVCLYVIRCNLGGLTQ